MILSGAAPLSGCEQKGDVKWMRSTQINLPKGGMPHPWHSQQKPVGDQTSNPTRSFAMLLWSSKQRHELTKSCSNRRSIYDRTVTRAQSMSRFAQLLLGILLVYSSAASAVGWKTQMNCASDYYAYCSNFAVGSADVRRCMRSNGPRLSKACVDALIADGEISRSEVGRIKEAAVSAKANVKADPKKVAADPQKPKPNDNRQATLSIEPTRAPRFHIVIDDRTVMALRNRTHLLEEGTGDVLLARDADGGDRTEQTASPAVTLGEQPIPNATSVDVFKEAQPTKSGGSILSVIPKDPRPAATQPARVAGEPSRPVANPPGKMSLGRNAPSEEAKDPANAEAWDMYMQNRFNGGMNYEGLGARFSKVP
jgi:hypothetical protein